MAGFKTHISFSTLLGVGYGGAAYMFYGVPLSTCVLAGGLCGVSGMLPDIDSDSGVPLRESLAFAAAVVPMMLVDRLQRLNMSPESIILAGAGVYLMIRFIVAALLKKYTVHRGMFHSLPAAAVFGELAFLLAPGEDVRLRWYQAGAVVLGYVSHLLLDEVYSFEWSRGRVHLKHSFGTALKLFSHDRWSNLSVYVKLVILTYLVFVEPNSMHTLRPGDPQPPGLQAAQEQPGFPAGQRPPLHQTLRVKPRR